MVQQLLAGVHRFKQGVFREQQELFRLHTTMRQGSFHRWEACGPIWR